MTAEQFAITIAVIVGLIGCGLYWLSEHIGAKMRQAHAREALLDRLYRSGKVNRF